MQRVTQQRVTIGAAVVAVLLVVAGLAGLVATRNLATSVSVPPVTINTNLGIGDAYATQAACEAAGYRWDSRLGCADRPCTGLDGRTYQPWHFDLVTNADQSISTYVCSGWTGTMSKVQRVVQSKGTPVPETGPSSPHYATASSCLSAGYLWIAGGCFDQSCAFEGDTYGPGRSIIVWVSSAQGREEQIGWCDGLTGTGAYIPVPRARRFPFPVPPAPIGNAGP
jgi:hypothetical protein